MFMGGLAPCDWLLLSDLGFISEDEFSENLVFLKLAKEVTSVFHRDCPLKSLFMTGVRDVISKT